MLWVGQHRRLNKYILLQNHANHGGAVALNSSINYLGSALGSALGGIILLKFINTNMLIYSAIIITVIGIMLQIMNITIDRKIINLVFLLSCFK